MLAVGSFDADVGLVLEVVHFLRGHIQIFEKLLVFLLFFPFLPLVFVPLHLLLLEVPLQGFLSEFEKGFVVVGTIAIVGYIVIETLGVDLATGVGLVRGFQLEGVFEEGGGFGGRSEGEYGVFDLFVLVFEVVGGLHAGEVGGELFYFVLVLGVLLLDDFVADEGVGGEDCLRNGNVHYRNINTRAALIKTIQDCMSFCLWPRCICSS